MIVCSKKTKFTEPCSTARADELLSRIAFIIGLAKLCLLESALTLTEVSLQQFFVSHCLRMLKHVQRHYHAFQMRLKHRLLF